MLWLNQRPAALMSFVLGGNTTQLNWWKCEHWIIFMLCFTCRYVNDIYARGQKTSLFLFQQTDQIVKMKKWMIFMLAYMIRVKRLLYLIWGKWIIFMHWVLPIWFGVIRLLLNWSDCKYEETEWYLCTGCLCLPIWFGSKALQGVSLPHQRRGCIKKTLCYWYHHKYCKETIFVQRWNSFCSSPFRVSG